MLRSLFEESEALKTIRAGQPVPPEDIEALVEAQIDALLDILKDFNEPAA